MALEFICSIEIEKGKKINIPTTPKRPNCYRLKSGKINFFYINPSIDSKSKPIPDKAKIFFFTDMVKAQSHVDYYGPFFN